MQGTGMVGRFAPSPSGRLHLGNMACALLAYLSAKSQGGRFLLRIEDLDVPRCPPKWAYLAMRDLERFGIEWDAEPLWQSKRTEVYMEAFRQLQAQGVIYPCFCTRAEIMEASRAPNLGDTQRIYPGTCFGLDAEEIRRRSLLRTPAYRVHVPDVEITFEDRLQGTYRENLKTDCGDFVIRRADGLYGYQLAVVVDDDQSGVTEVVRGRDILSATPRQIYLARLLGLREVSYAHIPLLLDAQGRRLAKRDQAIGLDAVCEKIGADGVRGLLACSMGLIPEPAPMSMQELIACFDWNKVPRRDAMPVNMETGGTNL